MDEEIALEQLGLTKIEANVYMTLIKLGSTTTGPVVKKTELHRATVYDALKRLMEKGLVSYIVKEKTKHFSATSPEHLFGMVEEQKKDVEKKEKIAKDVTKALNKIKELSKNKEVAHIFQGKRGVKTVYEDVLRYKENWVLGSSGRFLKIMGPYFYQYQKRKKELKIHTKLLVAERIRGTDVETTVSGERRFIPDEFESPISTVIYGDKVATFVWLENPVAFLIESKEAAESYRNYFRVMWNIAKK